MSTRLNRRTFCRKLESGVWRDNQSDDTHFHKVIKDVGLMAHYGTLCGNQINLNGSVTLWPKGVVTCPECQKHMENGTFINFVGELKKIEEKNNG